MRNFYYSHSLVFLIAVASLNSYVLGKSNNRDTNRLSKVIGVKTTDRSYLKNGIRVALPPLKAATPTGNSNVTLANNNTVSSKFIFSKYEPFKTLSNVQVYPNPITDQINLRYNITKNSAVTIKIMDVLGNDVVTLFSQRVDPGDQKFTFNLNNKLSSGFYFVRINVGAESVTKRISIL